MAFELEAACKVCGGRATFLGSVDMNKSCESWKEPVVRPSGVNVDYLRCEKCKFVFTKHFDGWTRSDWLNKIYNADYIKVDPEYVGVRAEKYGELIAGLLRAQNVGLSILDNGGGSGHLAQVLRGYGFSDVSTYEPFNPAFASPPARKFNVITWIEVFEHHPTPTDLINELATWLEDDGLVIFSTGLYTPDTSAPDVSWWYIAPRNGHISIYSPWALDTVWRNVGFRSGTLSGEIHLAFRHLPDFARHLIPR